MRGRRSERNKPRHPPRKGRGPRSEGERGSSPTRVSGPLESPPLAVPHTRELRRLLEGIGTPPPAPFKPDPFQLEALSALEFEDVLVTAPSGSGKTWIAREEIRRL